MLFKSSLQTLIRLDEWIFLYNLQLILLLHLSLGKIKLHPTFLWQTCRQSSKGILFHFMAHEDGKEDEND